MNTPDAPDEKSDTAPRTGEAVDTTATGLTGTGDKAAAKPTGSPSSVGVYLLLWGIGVVVFGSIGIGPFFGPLVLAWTLGLGVIFLTFFLTRRLPVFPRELIVSYIIALCLAPGVFGGHGLGVCPALVMVLYGWAKHDFDWAFRFALWSIHIVFFLVLLVRFFWRFVWSNPAPS